ncbi:MAG TPA: hypothetical protein VMI94_20900 [Bryobacteraceae bacterium]|nr:hypothetical protein [Bryobacteraceae bacterium]
MHARLRELIRYPRSRKLLAARGAAVEGRIVAMQHWLEAPRHFIFSLALEKIETESGPRPVFARLELGQRKSFVLPPMGQSPLVATLYFETREESHRIPAGYQMEWVTVKPPVENQ